MFLGEFQHTLDAKGRVSLPRRFRDEIGTHVVVTKALNKSLWVFPAEGYERFAGKMLAAGEFDPDARNVQLHFTTGAAPVDIDGAGRVAITPGMRAFASLAKDVAVLGAGNHIEIWDAEAWASFQASSAETIEKAAQQLAHGGLL